MAYTTQTITGYHSTYFIVFTNQEILYVQKHMVGVIQISIFSMFEKLSYFK